MALSGSFSQYPVTASYGNFGLYCEWSGSQSYSGNYTDITLKVYVRYWELYVGARSDSTVSINGVSETYTAAAISHDANSDYYKLIKTYTVRVKHNANGKKTGVKLSASWRMSGTYSGVSVGTITASATIDLDAIPVYSLSVSAGTGSSITVNRTSSGFGGTGNLSNGATLYTGDKLKITFTPSTNYAIHTHKVNNTTFTSGNTHTVSGNVSVVSTAQVLASSVGATNANIGAVSTITITKYNTSYYHTLQYSFGNLSGYITSSGGVSSNASKFSETSVPFTIPTSFYAQIPNAKTGKCTITCKTYSSSSSSTQLGNATTCQITVTATGSPSVNGTVVDTNATTIALTGNANKLIRYKSTAVATISATAQNSSTISTKYINDIAPNSSNQRTFSGVSTTSFVFKATDSRGYTGQKTVTPAMVSYINLTLNPIITRPTPTGSEIKMTFTGDYYRGSFGAYSNTLKIQYRYRESTSTTWSSWATVASTNYSIGTQTYSTPSAISLGTNFDYQKSYVFQVRATDGTEDYPLSTVTKTVTVQRGIPVFDWGEDDFEFHVNVKISDGSLKIGNTTITEAQLQSLLALL